MKTTNHTSTRLGLLAALFLLTTISALAQTFTLKGNVKDDTGEGAIGATIRVEGTTNGTIADFDGNFSLENVKVGQSIVVGYIGFRTETIAVTSQAPINVTLRTDDELLDEVVVVGYGAQKKSNISGAVSTVKADELPRAASASLGEMLRGRSSGMQQRKSRLVTEHRYSWRTQRSETAHRHRRCTTVAECSLKQRHSLQRC